MKDNTNPKGKWTFDSDVALVFDDMLSRSIPQYDVMRNAVTQIGAKYAIDDTYIIDLGCSRGKALKPFVDLLPNNHFLGIEISEPMALAARAEFNGNERVIIRQDDLRHCFPSESASVMLSILTLQFIPIEYRQQIIENIYNGLIEGGALILVEKVLGNTARINQNMVDIYYQLKANNGYSQNQIERKRLSLEGVLVPVTSKWNEDLMYQAGFKYVDSFWRWMNFVGWIAIK